MLLMVILLTFSFCLTECPKNTYKDFQGYADSCRDCPANSGHLSTGSTSILDCVCFTGYDGYPEYGNDCTSKTTIRIDPSKLMLRGKGLGLEICRS